MVVDGYFILAGLLATVIGLLAAACLARGDASRGRRRCGRCWYDMSRVSGLRCPECGWEARHEIHLFRTRRRWRWIGASVLLSAAGVVLVVTGAVGWPQMVPAAVWRAVMPHLDPGAERELATIGLDSTLKIDRMSRWERLRFAHRCALVLDGAACSTSRSGRAVQQALLGLVSLTSEARIALPSVERVFRGGSASADEREFSLLVMMDNQSLARSAALAEQVAMEDPDADVRHTAVRHLLWRGKKRREIVPVLARLLRAGDPQVRHDAAAGLGEFGAMATAALGELDRVAASDPDPEVRDRALGAAILIRADAEARAARRRGGGR